MVLTYVYVGTQRNANISIYLLPCSKLNFKWIKDLKIIPVTLNLEEEKGRSSLECAGAGDHFLTPVAHTATQQSINGTS